MISVLSSSDEYYVGSHFTDDQWLDNAYHQILDRGPDTGGAVYYRGFFSSGGSNFWQRFQVAWSMERSAENAASWTGAVYGAALQRGPSKAEFGAGMAFLQGAGNWQTFRLWTNVLASDDAYALGSAVPVTN